MSLLIGTLDLHAAIKNLQMKSSHLRKVDGESDR